MSPSGPLSLSLFPPPLPLSFSPLSPSLLRKACGRGDDPGPYAGTGHGVGHSYASTGHRVGTCCCCLRRAHPLLPSFPPSSLSLSLSLSYSLSLLSARRPAPAPSPSSGSSFLLVLPLLLSEESKIALLPPGDKFFLLFVVGKAHEILGSAVNSWCREARVTLEALPRLEPVVIGHISPKPSADSASVRTFPGIECEVELSVRPGLLTDWSVEGRAHACNAVRDLRAAWHELELCAGTSVGARVCIHRVAVITLFHPRVRVPVSTARMPTFDASISMVRVAVITLFSALHLAITAAF
mmetsp:Transcript_32713/g.78147  ORF Transcript_32713/g.78147 Transcript_32713/m.78147 type:complete len:297 (+) Transcript_32713:1476-2366(+)